MYIIDNIVCSDHIPLCIEIECDIVPLCNSTFIKELRDVCRWNLAGDKEKLSYKTCTNELFSDIIIPVDALLCNNGPMPYTKPIYSPLVSVSGKYFSIH